MGRHVVFVDASVIVALILREPGWPDLWRRLKAHHAPLYFSPLVRFETVQAFARKRISGSGRETVGPFDQAQQIFDDFVHRLGLQEIPISPEIGQAALAASTRYGKAVGHPAGLNFGDCFAYACAKTLAVPLAYIGNDFSLTDLA